MRAGSTYRYARREAAKLVAKTERRPMAEIWQGAFLRLTKKAKLLRRRAEYKPSLYFPHQGEREIERRLARV